MENLTKQEREDLKAQKKAEKLAKLELKKSMKPVVASVKVKKVPVGGYNSTEVEKYWVDYWIKNQSFIPEQKEGNKTFCMCIPPPNITGSLHIGHGMMIAIQDCIVRFKRLTGHEVLFLPGTDHAGIATQTVVMKSLGKAVDRETFLKAAFEWSDKYGSRIYEQFDRLGTSLDYTRKVFTVDKERTASVNRAFCNLFKKGLIYRDTKIVSWCGKLKTTLSDLEVDYKNIDGGAYIETDGGKYKFGMLYYIKYYLCRTKEVPSNFENLPYLIVATSRPETILGDSAICVNPNDLRFSDLDQIFKNGFIDDIFNENHRSDEEKVLDACNENEELKKERKNKYKNVKTIKEEVEQRKLELFAINPVTRETIPVILDEQADLAFGTGVLKVTPCHDPVDFKLGKKHNLEFKRILDDQNKISHAMYNGINRFEARKMIAADLKKSAMLVKEEEHGQILPFCSRSGDVIEPMIKEQWWCECKGMSKRALDAIKDNEIEIHPEEAKNIWYRWLENPKDWCLSRQLWWGHRVPAYKAFNSNGETDWIVSESYDDALTEAKSKGFERIEQDEDVLDTWFSSGLWPFSTLGWPNEESPDFKKFFPNSVLETGSDILFFWVARMVMLSYELTGKKPFDKILLHGLIRDAHGRKMSKSLGNVIDPIDVIDGIELEDMINNLKKGNLDPREVKRACDAMKLDFPNGIAKCGADALRFTLISYTNGINDVNLDILRVLGNARLCNKIYNAFIFVKNAVSSSLCEQISSISLDSKEFKPHHKWILENLNKTIEEQHSCLDSYRFMDATKSIYQFFYEFCDNFIEVSKNPSATDIYVLKYTFNAILAIFHPYMPFITTDLYFKLNNSLLKDYPVPYQGDLKNEFEDILSLARICRSNEKVSVQNFEDIHYLKCLVKTEFTVSDDLEEFELLGSLKYKILN